MEKMQYSFRPNVKDTQREKAVKGLRIYGQTARHSSSLCCNQILKPRRSPGLYNTRCEDHDVKWNNYRVVGVLLLCWEAPTNQPGMVLGTTTAPPAANTFHVAEVFQFNKFRALIFVACPPSTLATNHHRPAPRYDALLLLPLLPLSHTLISFSICYCRPNGSIFFFSFFAAAAPWRKISLSSFTSPRRRTGSLNLPSIGPLQKWQKSTNEHISFIFHLLFLEM